MEKCSIYGRGSLPISATIVCSVVVGRMQTSYHPPAFGPESKNKELADFMWSLNSSLFNKL
jgi:hypothetical protein